LAHDWRVSELTTQQLEVPAEVGQLARVRAFVRSVAARLGANPAPIADVVQAVDECVTNSIVHGYSGRPGTVEVELERHGRDLVVRLRDSAPPFDPTVVPAPNLNLPLNLRPLGGMGVFLARDLTDTMSYRRTDEGNELTLIKGCIETVEVDEVRA
jgi:anti-sigma regulatory factor (Ser/Thr protein kinase)